MEKIKIFNNFQEKSLIYDKLYKDIDGYDFSHHDRGKISFDESEFLIYGEMSFETLMEIYEKTPSSINLDKCQHFCDLGSGIGRIVVGTSLLLENLKTATGIELLKLTNYMATRIKRKTDKNIHDKINFIRGDFFDYDFSNTDLIFMHYPMKNAEPLYLKLDKKLATELKSGAVVISVIRRMKEYTSFSNLGSMVVKTGYGTSTVFYYVKR
jgi:SAM-dependent methyltransferase